MLLASLAQHAKQRPAAAALVGANSTVSYADLEQQVSDLTRRFAKQPHACIAVAVENHPAWAIIDFSVAACCLPSLPLPFFFTDAQLHHALQDAGASTLLTDKPERFHALLGDKITASTPLVIAGKNITQLELSFTASALPASTAKITYTSGTTGNPKGVCLSMQAMLLVAQSIRTAAELTPDNQHLCVLPLSTLLENVAGLYATILAGGTAHLLPAAEIGFSGTGLDVATLISALKISRANTAILLPEILQSMVSSLEKSGSTLPDARFLAVGGASVSPSLLTRAEQLRLPVFEGYGLSECASVVSLNTFKSAKNGSVGKPLPHAQVKVADDGEIWVKGACYLGYTKNEAHEVDWIATGDIGFFDEDGYLHINGRKKNLIINSFGRNLSPEWVERELNAQPAILQSALFGEAQPFNCAVIVASPQATSSQIAAAIADVNQTLPEYAQVSKWLLADAPFTPHNNQLTPNGRLKREVIWQHYGDRLNDFYLPKN